VKVNLVPRDPAPRPSSEPPQLTFPSKNKSRSPLDRNIWIFFPSRFARGAAKFAPERPSPPRIPLPSERNFQVICPDSGTRSALRKAVQIPIPLSRSRYLLFHEPLSPLRRERQPSSFPHDRSGRKPIEQGILLSKPSYRNFPPLPLCAVHECSCSREEARPFSSRPQRCAIPSAEALRIRLTDYALFFFQLRASPLLPHLGQTTWSLSFSSWPRFFRIPGGTLSFFRKRPPTDSRFFSGTIPPSELVGCALFFQLSTHSLGEMLSEDRSELRAPFSPFRVHNVRSFGITSKPLHDLRIPFPFPG